VVSYNRVLPGQSGWKTEGDNTVLLLQGDDEFVAVQGLASVSSLVNEGERLVEALWSELEEALPTLDTLVIYVGGYGSERGIELAAEHGVPAEKLVFVGCDCNQRAKLAMMERHGYDSVPLVESLCGGQGTMLMAYQALLASGRWSI
jgi:hypothetical protein